LFGFHVTLPASQNVHSTSKNTSQIAITSQATVSADTLFHSFCNFCLIEAESRRQHVANTVEKLITNSIHTAFIKYPEGDGDANMDYDWISPEQSSRITKAILLDLAANGFEIVKKGAA